MIRISKAETYGWEAAIRGMRNPMNSWDKSDSYPAVDCGKCGIIDREGICHPKEHDCSEFACYAVGENDLSIGGKNLTPTRWVQSQIRVAQCTRFRQKSLPWKISPRITCLRLILLS